MNKVTHFILHYINVVIVIVLCRTFFEKDFKKFLFKSYQMIIKLFCHSTNLLNIETLNLPGTHTHTELNPLSLFTVLPLSVSGNRKEKHTKRFHWDKNYILSIMSNFAWSFKNVVCYRVQVCTAPQHDETINPERRCWSKELQPCSESFKTQMMDLCPKEPSHLC